MRFYRALHFLFPGFLLNFALGASADEYSETFTPYPEKSGVVLKTGWDSFRGEKTPGSCVIAGNVTDKGQKRAPHYAEITDTTSLMTAFSISGDAKVGAMGAGANASASFSKNIQIENYGLNISVDIKIVDGAAYLVPLSVEKAIQHFNDEKVEQHFSDEKLVSLAGAIVSFDETPFISGDKDSTIRLSKEMASLAKSDPKTFQQTCGDAFVSTIRSGSGIQGIYSIITRSTNEKQVLEGKLGGSNGVLSASTSVQTQLQSLESESRLEIKYFQLGGEGTPIAVDDKSFRSLVQAIGTKTSPGTPFEIGVIPYKRLPNYPQSHGPKKADAELIADQYFRLFSIDRQINSIITNKKIDGDGWFYDKKITVDSLSKTQDDIKQGMKKLSDAINSCSVNPKTCTYPSTLEKTDYIYRSRIPLRNGAINSWNSLQIANEKLSNAVSTLSVTSQTIRRQVVVGGTPINTYEPNLEYTRLLAKIVDLKQNVKTITSNLDSTYIKLRQH